MAKQVIVKRAYDRSPSTGHYRVLVDRLWPRGINKADLEMDEWCKAIAPSSSLRLWFGHRQDRWEPFKQAYTLELQSKQPQVNALVRRSGKQPLCLIYAAKDPNCNHALVLKNFIETLYRTLN